ncbi:MULTISPECIES: helix-turn-helix domain-containing protein [unclassified Synechococcus]|uniref:helix-turn-helix domain-containing protein n=1 Tax=unclassified Synechococcus TaxID=2626047 RepID=UPI0013C2BB5D|nr:MULTISPECIES: helix-turn-helix domain-containing protein [unclassified Synechococcus]
MTKSTLKLNQPLEPNPANPTDELLLPWLIELHRIRQMRNASDRLLNLLQVLVERFGRRTSDGFVMAWPLSHERLGEVISANRSTITRILNRWSERGQVVIDPTKKTLWMTPQTMAQS